MDPAKELAERIKTYRRENRLSQTAFGKQLGVTKLTVINWETGKTYPHNRDVMDALNEVLKDEKERSAPADPYDIIEMFSEILKRETMSDKEKLNLIFNLQCEYIAYTSDPAGYVEMEGSATLQTP